MSRSARLHADGKTRCPWPGEDPFYMAYHDTEWGVPEYDDRALFEKLILPGPGASRLAVGVQARGSAHATVCFAPGCRSPGSAR